MVIAPFVVADDTLLAATGAGVVTVNSVRAASPLFMLI
jgi:hypothetical protein